MVLLVPCKGILQKAQASQPWNKVKQQPQSSDAGAAEPASKAARNQSRMRLQASKVTSKRDRRPFSRTRNWRQPKPKRARPRDSRESLAAASWRVDPQGVGGWVLETVSASPCKDKARDKGRRRIKRKPSKARSKWQKKERVKAVSHERKKETKRNTHNHNSQAPIISISAHIHTLYLLLFFHSRMYMSMYICISLLFPFPPLLPSSPFFLLFPLLFFTFSLFPRHQYSQLPLLVPFYYRLCLFYLSFLLLCAFM